MRADVVGLEGRRRRLRGHAFQVLQRSEGRRPKAYQLLNHIGRGACAPPPLLLLRKAPLTRDCGAADGEVWAACTPGQPNEKVAIKKITQVFSQVTEAKRILRELRILRHLDHPNLIRFARPHARRALHVPVAH